MRDRDQEIQGGTSRSIDFAGSDRVVARALLLVGSGSPFRPQLRNELGLFLGQRAPCQ
jgi:hypothetical protein